jgi:hypothetical protein
MSISTDRVFSNIYGPTATQETRSIMGGKKGGIIYLDETIGGGRKTQPRKVSSTATAKTPAKKVKESVTIYADLIHFPNKEINEYIDRLYLEYYVARAAPNTIFIIPPDSVRQSMYATIRSVTNGTQKGSIEEKKAIIENAEKIGFKRYIFSKFGDNKRDQLYKIGPMDNAEKEYPNAKFDPIRRTNAANEVFYMSYRTPAEINVSLHADLKEPVVCKFLGRCGHGIYVFGGDLPQGSPETYIPTYNKKSHTVIGGGSRKQSYATRFKAFVNGFDSIEQAAYAFCMKRFVNDKEFASQFINADNVYSMFAMALTDMANGKEFDEVLSNVSQNEVEVAEREMEAISYSRLTDNISRRINGAINKLYHRDDFDVVTHLESLYKNGDKNIIRADIMTALYRSGVTSVNDLFKLTNQFADGISGGDRYTDTLMEPYKMYPMTSVNGKAYPYIGQWGVHGGVSGGSVTIKRLPVEIEQEEETEEVIVESIPEEPKSKKNKHSKHSVKELAVEQDIKEEAFDDSVFY